MILYRIYYIRVLSIFYFKYFMYFYILFVGYFGNIFLVWIDLVVPFIYLGLLSLVFFYFWCLILGVVGKLDHPLYQLVEMSSSSTGFLTLCHCNRKGKTKWGSVTTTAPATLPIYHQYRQPQSAWWRASSRISCLGVLSIFYFNNLYIILIFYFCSILGTFSLGFY